MHSNSLEGNSNQSLRGTTQQVVVSADEGTHAYDAHQAKLKQKAAQANATLWQHPFVDVLKHFKVLPGNDWKLNKKQGGVEEYFAKEIGRRAINIEGTISANNFIQLPHPSANIKNLGLTGRYIYFQVKCVRHGLPFSYHIDLGMAERSHGVRISISNLFRKFDTQNGFVAQVPLELKNNCWSVVVIDIYEILRQSQILPSTYLIDGSYQVRSLNVCANTHVRGIFTSDNMYDFVTLPADMRFKFAFDLAKWPEYFDWQSLPHDWSSRKNKDQNQQLQTLINANQKKPISKEEQREQMKHEIDNIIGGPDKDSSTTHEQVDLDAERRQRYDAMQNALNQQFNKGPADHPVHGFIGVEDQGRSTDYRTGQFSGYELSKSHKLSKDPIMELKHIIGYQPEKCQNMKWSRKEGENVVVFTSGGTLIAMDSENNDQKRFFFGHSAPISCFDMNHQGSLLASAQEGNNAIIRIWDYDTARSIAFTLMPVQTVKCLSFSHDGRYLAGCGKDSHSRELVVIYDISKIQRGEKPEIVAKQTSEFNIIALKFSPIDSSRLTSCGKENIRFWRIKEQGNIRGSAVVLNHHARNTVFTCLDFEYGFVSTDKHQNESLKRVFVGSKHGMVFQVNYQSEVLEATFKTNDGAIQSISVNDAFCVTGSEDTFLRVWPLDFGEFFMEAQHEQTVTSVDISPDGLKVVCGTIYGSIGILDKSNQNYKTLLRSHTDEIIAIDFHRTKQNIISISKDKTIRLWSVDTYDEVYEFSSPMDQPLSVAAHPTLPIFSCGFEQGKMRVFDIDSTEVIEEFSQFNEPLLSLRYDNTGTLLVACAKNGQVSIHNASRQHLPVKMLHLEIPPEFVYVTFTEKTIRDPNCYDQKFALMGETGNNVNIYDTEAFMIQNQVIVNHIITQFRFANNNQDLVVVTKDCRIRFYSLFKFEGIFLREISNCHRGSISSLSISNNSGYFLTGGEDNMIKIWDYEAQKTHPFYFQSFIGHTYKVNDVIFNPQNNSQVITVGQFDGIYIWDFNGDVEQEYNQAHLASQDLPRGASDYDAPEGQKQERQLSMLEKIRTANKEKKAFRNLMSDDSFIIPEFRDFGQGILKKQIDLQELQQDFGSPIYVDEMRKDLQITKNHYASCMSEIESNQMQQLTIETAKKKQIEAKLVNGYDGFGGVHDNIVWNVAAGQTIFTLYNKLIVENTKNREQFILHQTSQVQLSCMTVTDDYKYVAVGEGSKAQNSQNAYIYIYDIETRQKINTKIGYHERGIQTMGFSKEKGKPKYLISVGTKEDGIIGLYNIEKGSVKSIPLRPGVVINQILVDPQTVGDHLMFYLVGNRSELIICRFDTRTEQCFTIDANVPENMRNKNFTTIAITERIPAPVDDRYIVIGADDGTLQLFSQLKKEGGEFIQEGLAQRQYFDEGEIMAISIKKHEVGGDHYHSVVIASSQGNLYRYEFRGSDFYPDGQNIAQSSYNDFQSSIVAISFDSANVEGLVGTEHGCIYFVSFEQQNENDCQVIKLVSSNNKFKEAINFIKYDDYNQNLFHASTSQKSADLKLYANQNQDQVQVFSGDLEDEGHVVFVIAIKNSPSASKSMQYSLVGFSKGVVKKLEWGKLQFKDTAFRINEGDMYQDERITCGFFSENDFNFVMGTNYGNIFIASIPPMKRKNKNKQLQGSYCKISNLGKMNSQMFQRDHSSNDLAQSSLNKDIMRTSQTNNSHILDEVNLSVDISNERMSDAGGENYFIGVMSVHLLSIDPIGTMVVAFDNGMVKVWQSAVKNEQLMKIIELQNDKKENQAVKYDISGVGYQQFDLIDSFDMFRQDSQEHDRLEEQLKSKKRNTYAQFLTTTFDNNIICFSDILPKIFIRDWKSGAKKVKIITLKPNHYPTCMKVVDGITIKGGQEDQKPLRNSLKGKTNLLLVTGTSIGKVQIWSLKHLQTTEKLIFESKEGLSFGSITSIDAKYGCEEIIAGTESGEMIQFDFAKKLNEEQ